jgi:opacity protein-like surface antigen
MIKKLLFSTLLLSFGIFTTTFAQTTTSDDYHKVEGFVGYSNNQVDLGISDDNEDFEDFFEDRQSFHGVNASVVGNFNRYVGIRGDVSVHFKDFEFDTGTPGDQFEVKARVSNFLAGVQVKDNSKEGSRFRPFAYGMVGVARNKVKLSSSFFTSDFCNEPGVDCDSFSDSETAFAAAIGGGLDINVSRRFSFRAFQLDYNPTRFGDSTQHNFRIGIGFVFH